MVECGVVECGEVEGSRVLESYCYSSVALCREEQKGVKESTTVLEC